MIPISKKILLLVILFIFLSHNIFSEDNELANLYYQSGLALMNENKYEEAIEKFNKSLSYRKEFPSVLFNLGECYKKLNNNKKSLKNYRLCIKSLNQIFRSKEEEELLSRVYRAMDKIDTNGKHLTLIKNSYSADILSLANDCANRKLINFAYQLSQLILQVEPSNKNAQELLYKLDKTKITPPKETKPTNTETPPTPTPEKEPPEKLFNGKDINNWEIKDKYPEYQTPDDSWGGQKQRNWRVK
ncbi:MAG: tetratricopeptide repeat protein, partial [Planctomycetota bacterium]